MGRTKTLLEEMQVQPLLELISEEDYEEYMVKKYGRLTAKLIMINDDKKQRAIQ